MLDPSQLSDQDLDNLISQMGATQSAPTPATPSEPNSLDSTVPSFNSAVPTADQPSLSNPQSQDYSSQSQAPAQSSTMQNVLGNLMFGTMAAESGATQGLKEAGQGLKQAALEGAEYFGLVKPGTTEEYTKQTDAQHAAYNNSFLTQLMPTTSQVAKVLGDTAPYLAVPGGIEGGLATRLGTGALAGAAIGGSQYVPDGGSRALNTAFGATAGAVLPSLIKGVTSDNPLVKAATGAGIGTTGALIDDQDPEDVAKIGLAGAVLPFVPGMAGTALSGLVNKVAPDLIDASTSPIDTVAAMNMLKGVDPQASADANAAAQRLGLDYLTPAEASGSPMAAATQGKLGSTEEGALQLQQLGEGRLNSEQASIDNLLNSAAPADVNYAPAVRDAANSVIDSQQKALSDTAQPLYDKAYSQTVPQAAIDTLSSQDPTIGNAINNVLQDPRYQFELNGYQPNSIKVLDLAKRNIDGQISAAQGTAMNPGNADLARVLTASKQRLVSATDGFSPDYAQARQTYSAGSPAVNQLRNSPLGKIADLDDTQVKNIPKIIFDPAQTDPNVLANLRDQISSVNPTAWNGIVRNEMERRLDSATPGAPGSQFYSQVLAKNRDFNQFLTATQNIPGAQLKLMDMRKAFQNLINPTTAKTAAGLAKSSLDVPRSSVEAITSIAKEFVGGKYDQAAIKLITSPDWDEQFAKIKNIQNPLVRSVGFSDLLSRITASNAPSSAAKEGQQKNTPPDLKSLSDDDLNNAIKAKAYLETRSPDVSPPPSPAPAQRAPMQPQSPVTPQLLHKISTIESGNNPNAQAPNGTASGLYQFTNGSWKNAVNKYGAETGITLAQKNNPQAQQVMVAKILNDNAKALTPILGHAPTDTDLYLTHFLGLGGAERLYSSNPNMLAASVLPAAALANRAIFYQNGHPLTVAQLYNNINTRVQTA
jgi:hypothetical protein